MRDYQKQPASSGDITGFSQRISLSASDHYTWKKEDNSNNNKQQQQAHRKDCNDHKHIAITETPHHLQQTPKQQLYHHHQQHQEQ